MNFPIGNQYIIPQNALEQVIKSRLVPGVLTSLWSRGADEPSGINNAVPQNEAMERMNSWRLIQKQILNLFFFFVFWLWKQMNKQTCLVEYEKWVLLVPRWMLFRSVTEQWLHSLTSPGQMEANQWQQCGNRTDFPIVTHLLCKNTCVCVLEHTHVCLFMSDGSSYLSFCVSSISRARLQVGISEFLCVCVWFCISVHCDNLWPLFFFSSLCFSGRTLWSWRRGTETTAHTAMVRIVLNTHRCNKWIILKVHYVVLWKKGSTQIHTVVLCLYVADPATFSSFRLCSEDFIFLWKNIQIQSLSLFSLRDKNTVSSS